MSNTLQKKIQDQNPKKIHQGRVLHSLGHTHLTAHPPRRQPPPQEHTHSHRAKAPQTSLLIKDILHPHTPLFILNLKSQRDFFYTLKKITMKNLFNLLLTLLCGVSCIAAITAESTEAFIFAGTLMCLSAICFLIPLFNKQ